MLISEVIDGVKRYCRGIDPKGDPIGDATTRDQVLWGKTERECTGIVTCIWASADVIREARSLGANLIISHEALFWNHGDHTDWLAEQHNKAFTAKRDLLDACDITVWRCHDYIHSGIPSPAGDGAWVDGIYLGLSRRLGWHALEGIQPLSSRPFHFSANIDQVSAEQLANDVVAKLNLNGARIIGDPATPVSRVAVSTHMFGFNDNEKISLMDEGVDCLLAMETVDFTVLQYVRDSSELGRPKAVISCGHFNIECPGMELMASWLPRALGEGAPTTRYVEAGDPFYYVAGQRQ